MGEKNRWRLRDRGIELGRLPVGQQNSIVDVRNVHVGQVTQISGHSIRTGVTAVLPHPGNLYQNKVPAGLVVGNGYGKLMGGTQIQELGEIETPILLTNTLAVPRAADAILDWTLSYPGNEKVRSVNAVVGETNDGKLNDIRARTLSVQDMLEALAKASSEPFAEGCVGAGTGTTALGWKGGIGTSSRRVQVAGRDFSVGVLVQTNFSGSLRIADLPLGTALAELRVQSQSGNTLISDGEPSNSIIILIATDLPMSDRNLTRMALRGITGLAKTGADMNNWSGDYAIAFSTHPGVRRVAGGQESISTIPVLGNDAVSTAFLAAMESTEEAILNSIFMATTMTGNGRTIRALPLDKVADLLEQRLEKGIGD